MSLIITRGYDYDILGLWIMFLAFKLKKKWSKASSDLLRAGGGGGER